MKCYEVTQCSEKERSTCYVWNSFRENPDDLENIKCWVLKNVYQPENRNLLKKCLSCKYYLITNKQTGVVSDYSATIATIALDGVLNNDKSRALTTVFETLKKNNKYRIILDLSKVNNVYSCGLGVIITIHKEAKEHGGTLVVCGPSGYTAQILESTKLVRLLKIVPDQRAAKDYLDERIAAEKAAAETIARELEAKSAQEASHRAEQDRLAAIPAKKIVPEKRPQCFEYWNNRNPNNATACDECFKKVNPSNQPCWIVEGEIEGISFQYVNEDCEDCEYYQKFSEG